MSYSSHADNLIHSAADSWVIMQNPIKRARLTTSDETHSQASYQKNPLNDVVEKQKTPEKKKRCKEKKERSSHRETEMLLQIVLQI